MKKSEIGDVTGMGDEGGDSPSEKRKVGRKTNASKLGNLPRSESLDRFLKRKREEGGAGGEENRIKMQAVDQLGLKGLKEYLDMQFNSVREEVRDKTEELRNDLALRDERWEREREMMEKEIGELREEIKELRKRERGMEIRMARMEVEWREDAGDRGGREGEQHQGLKEKVERIENILETEEKEKRKTNLIIKGINTEEGNLKERVMEVIRAVSEEINPKEMRKVGRWGERGTVWVGLGNKEERDIILKNRNRLKGRREWVEEDLTWKERKAQWKVREVAQILGRKGLNVRVGQGRVWIDGRWWKWMEETDDLRDRNGRVWNGIEKRGGEAIAESEVDEEAEDLENTIIGQ